MTGTQHTHDPDDTIPEFLCRRCHPEMDKTILVINGIRHSPGCKALKNAECTCGAEAAEF